jgi:hypothetical protein
MRRREPSSLWFFTIENLGFHHRKWWFNGDLMGISWKITIFNG